MRISTHRSSVPSRWSSILRRGRPSTPPAAPRSTGPWPRPTAWPSTFPSPSSSPKARSSRRPSARSPRGRPPASRRLTRWPPSPPLRRPSAPPAARSFLCSRELNRYEPKGGSSLGGLPARLLAPFDMNESPIAPYHLSDRRSLVPLPIRSEANDIDLLYIASPGITPSQPPGGASIRTVP